MAMLEIKVTFVGDGAGKVVDNPVNRVTIFMFGPAAAGHSPRGKYRNTMGAPFGAYDLNNVAAPGSISVTSFAPIRFDSVNFYQNQALINDICNAIEKGTVKVVDVTAPGTALTRTEISAFI